MAESPMKLQKKFEATWDQDFDDVKELGEKAWLIRLYMRVNTNQDTRLCNKEKASDLAIQRRFGWDRKTIRKAKRKLLELGYIVQKGHCLYYVRPGWRLSIDWGKSPQSTNQSQLGKNSPPTGEKFPTKLGKNSPPTGEKFPTHIADPEHIEPKHAPQAAHGKVSPTATPGNDVKEAAAGGGIGGIVKTIMKGLRNA